MYDSQLICIKGWDRILQSNQMCGQQKILAHNHNMRNVSGTFRYKDAVLSVQFYDKTGYVNFHYGDENASQQSINLYLERLSLY